MPNSSKRSENIKLVTEFFVGEDSFLPLSLAQMCLEFSGCLRIGKKSLVFITFRIPHYRGSVLKRIKLEQFRTKQKPNPFDNIRYV